MSGLLGVPVDAAYHLVFALTHLLTPVAGGLAAAAAIVLFTAAVRLLISPLSFRALRGQAAMARLAPQVQALRTRHRRQPEHLQRELTALYKREGTGPFSGILPLLVQWPFLSVMYLLFRSATVGGGQNQLLSDGLFGVPLGAHWLSGGGLLSVHDVLFLATFAVLAALCWLSARLAKRAAPAAMAPAAIAPAAATVRTRRVDRVPAPAARAGKARDGAAEQAADGKGGGQSRKGTAGKSPEGAPAKSHEVTAAQSHEVTAGQSRAEVAQSRKGAGQSRKGTAGQSREVTAAQSPVAAGQSAGGKRARGAGPSAAGTAPDPAEALANSKAAGLLTRVLPYVTVVIAAFAPLAAAIYLLTTVAWTLAERRLFLRRSLSPTSTGFPGSTGRAPSVTANETR
jgi:YidC/Oxa1 family membrane protein insertase